MRRAFTLVELMIVLLILAIVGAAVVPYAASGDSLSAKSAASRLSTDLEYAQNVAITTQQAVTATFDASTESYVLSNASGVLIHPIDKDDYRVRYQTEDGFASVNLVSADFGGSSSVSFDSLGAPSSGGTVMLQAGPHTYQVTVAPATGIVSVAETTAD